MPPYSIWIDVLLIVVFALIINQPWQSHKLDDEKRAFLIKPEERQIAASAIRDEAMACVTVASILLVAIGAALGATGGLGADAKDYLRNAAILCIASLVLGVWILGSLPTSVNFYNVAQRRGFAIFAVMQVGLTILGAWRVGNGLWIVLR